MKKFFQNADPSVLRRPLLEWYDAHGRDLPWRKAPSLYKTVVSEFMLQQTQVATVLPYFERWIRRFPDFQALAGAPESEVLKAWEGLGYYSRVRNLQKLARALLELPTPPNTYEDWLKLPGVGPYTAAAIASIAFDRTEAVVDGNVIRVLARLLADPTPYPSASAAQQEYRPIADKVLDPTRPGDSNQALMELGATVCRPRNPTCLLCPVRFACHAAALGQPESYPTPKPRKTVARTILRIALSRSRGNERELLLQQIPEGSRRLAGQWQLPEIDEKQLPDTAELIAIKKRGISNERITERLYSLGAGRLPGLSDCRWVPESQLSNLTLPGPHRRWIKELLL